jgi:nucleoid DNA-binding protein
LGNTSLDEARNSHATLLPHSFLALCSPQSYTGPAGSKQFNPIYAYMTKRDLVMRISDETGLAQVQVANALEKAFDAIIASLSRGEGVEIRNFGVFEVRHRRPRVGRKPTDPSKLYQIPARAVVKFKPGKEMKEIVMKQATQLQAAQSSAPAAPP